MSVEVDDTVLDDVPGLAERDPDHMLRAVASAAAQIRTALTASAEAGLEQLEQLGRPRAVVVAGMGGSGIAGDVLAAMAAPSAQAPVVVQREPGLPGWVGAADVVVAVSCSGGTQETLAAADEAVRRGATLVGIGADGSPLARRRTQARPPSRGHGCGRPAARPPLYAGARAVRAGREAACPSRLDVGPRYAGPLRRWPTRPG